MKKIALSFALSAAFVSPIYAALLLRPVLISPLNTDTVGLKQDLKFSWAAKNPAAIKQYHLIISTNERFTDYDVANNKCVKATTCFDVLVKDSSKTLPASHPFLQKETTYYWQVQAIANNGDKSLVFQGSKNSSSGTGIVRKKIAQIEVEYVGDDSEITDY